jgi:YegS/Rv2252/BmrU family lipid kinase
MCEDTIRREDAAMRACLIFNPTARSGRGRIETVARGCTLRPTRRPGQGAEIAAAACREGFDTLIAAGGDGTVSEVADGIARVPGALGRVRLGVVPLGTVNVFARELGLPLDPAAAWRVVEDGRETRVDLPCVALQGAGGSSTRHFVQVAGVGLDARAIALVNLAWKRRAGPLAYGAAALRALSGRQPEVRLSGSGGRAAGSLVLVGNGRLYGGRAVVLHPADLRDGRLTVRIFPRVTALTLLRLGWAALTGGTLANRDDVTFSGERFEVGGDAPLPVQVDGDLVGFTPAVFTVRRRALTVLTVRHGIHAP